MTPILRLGTDPDPYAYALWLLLGLFVLRVLGQVGVVVCAPRWLPEMKQWYSGLIPYPVLLPVQILFLAVMTCVALHVSTRVGFFAVQLPATGLFLVWFSLVYAGSMGVRLVRWLRTPVTERRAWIPIIFHVVLAAFLFVLGSWYVAG